MGSAGGEHQGDHIWRHPAGEHFSDEQGRLLDTPELPSSTITIILESEGNKTRLIIVHEGLGGGEHTLAQYKEGWSQVFDRLKATLS